VFKGTKCNACTAKMSWSDTQLNIDKYHLKVRFVYNQEDLKIQAAT